MNNIHDKDWAEESWGGFSGMGNGSDWGMPEKSRTELPQQQPDGEGVARDVSAQ